VQGLRVFYLRVSTPWGSGVAPGPAGRGI